MENVQEPNSLFNLFSVKYISEIYMYVYMYL